MSINNRKCAKCGNTRASDLNITFHKFPNPGKNGSNMDKCRVWADYIFGPVQEWDEKALFALHWSSKILCGRHFDDEQFINKTRQKLKKSAVPTVEGIWLCEDDEVPGDVEIEVELDGRSGHDEGEMMKLEYLSDVEESEVVEDGCFSPPPDEPPPDESMTPEYLSDWETLEADATATTENLSTLDTVSISEVRSLSTGVVDSTSVVSAVDASEVDLKALLKDVTVKRVIVPKPEPEEPIEDIHSQDDLERLKKVKEAQDNLNKLIEEGFDPSTIPKIGRKRKRPENKKPQVTITRSSVKQKPKAIKSTAPKNKEFIKIAITDDEIPYSHDEPLLYHVDKETDLLESDEEYRPGSDYGSDSEYEPNYKKNKVEIDIQKIMHEASRIKAAKRKYGVCRCCLKEDMHDIADNMYTLLDCLNFAPNDDPGLSTLVCSGCSKFLQEVHTFRDMVNKSEKTLLTQLQEEKIEITVPALKTESVKLESTNASDDGQAYSYDEGTQSDDPDDFKVALPTQEDVLKKPLTVREARKILRRRPQQKETKRQICHNLLTIITNSTIIPFTYNKKPALINHFECIYGDARYEQFHLFREHMKTNHAVLDVEYLKKFLYQLQDGILRADVSNLTCTLCNERLSDVNRLVEHLVNVHDKLYHQILKDPPHGVLGFDLSVNELRCPECNKLFAGLRGLIAHMNMHYGEYLCAECGSKFIYFDSYRRHVFTHKEIRPIKSIICDMCGEVFQRRPDLWLHKKTIHCMNKVNQPIKGPPQRRNAVRKPRKIKIPVGENGVYDCKLCDAEFPSINELFDHRLQHLYASKAEKHQCEVCSYVTPNKKFLKVHLKRHWGIKNYTCQVCKKTYVTSSLMKLHMKVHNVRFECPLCNATFVLRQDIQSHLKTQHAQEVKINNRLGRKEFSRGVHY